MRAASLTTLGVFVGLLTILAASSILVPNHDGSPAESPPDLRPASVGESLYGARCAPCHGELGDANVSVATTLRPRPRDFTHGVFKFRSTEPGSLPTDDDLLSVVRNGLHGTAMIDWGHFIGEDSLRMVIEYMKKFSPRFASERPRPVRTGAPVPGSAASLAAGRKIYERLQCAACHGTDGGGTGAAATEFVDDRGDPVSATNLTEPWTFRGGASPRDVFLRLRTGLDGTPMPSYGGLASDAELWHLTNYVLSLSRKPVWSMSEPEMRAFYERQDSAATANPVKRGEYLVRAMGCSGCHAKFNADGTIDPGNEFAGGLVFDLTPFGEAFAANLSSDPETGLGAWSDEEIERAFTNGISRDGRKLMPFPMPWVSYSQLKEVDKGAIVSYLRTLPPVNHRVPSFRRPGFFSYLWGKFRMLVLKEQFANRIYPMKEE